LKAKKRPLQTQAHPDEVKSLYVRHGATLVAYARSYGLDHASAEEWFITCS